jgi:apolipoprotein N-acyltransferase
VSKTRPQERWADIDEPVRKGFLNAIFGRATLATAEALDPRNHSEDPAFVLRRNYAAVGLSALLSFAAFHPFDLGFLAYVALVPLLYVSALSRPMLAALMAYCATVLYHVPGLSWIAMTTPSGWIVTSFMEGGYGIALICLPLFIRRRTGTPLAISLPLLGVILECIRGNFPFISFPWLFWGHTQHAQLTLAQIADVTSIYGLTGIVLLVNGALADVILMLRARNATGQDLSPADLKRLRLVVGLPMAVVILALSYGYLRRGQVEQAMEEAGPGPRLVLVQPDLPQTLKDSGSAIAAANENLRGSKVAIAAAGGQKIDALLWTETMWFWPLPDGRPGAAGKDDQGNDLDGLAVYQGWRDRNKRGGEALERGVKYLRAAKASGDRHDVARALDGLRKMLRRPDADEATLVRTAQSWAAETRQFPIVERELLSLPSQIKAPVLVGAVDLDVAHKRENPHNSYYQIVPDGQGGGKIAARYDKVECVPVSEYIPFKSKDSFLHSFHQFMKGFVPPGFLVFERGKGPVLMDAGEFKLSPNICFEISFPELLRRGTAAGADVHVCPANDAWFVRGGRGANERISKTAEIDLARAHSVFRAIENRRSVVRCVNRGVSLCVDPTGVVIDELTRLDPETGKPLSIGIEGSLTVQPPVTKLKSFYVRFGNVFAWVCGLGALILLWFARAGRELFPPTQGVATETHEGPDPDAPVAPAEETPTEEASTEEAPTEEAPAEEAATEEAPAEEAATEEAPAEEAVTEKVPAEEAATEEVPTEEAPTEHGEEPNSGDKSSSD